MLKRKRKRNLEELKFSTKNYSMKETYPSSDLVVASLEYVSSEVTPYGPMVETTKQKYFFRLVEDGEDPKYQELFTGYVTNTESQYFDVPYVVNVKPLTEEIPNVSKKLHRYGLLLLLNEINTPKKVKVKETNNGK